MNIAPINRGRDRTGLTVVIQGYGNRLVAGLALADGSGRADASMVTTNNPTAGKRHKQLRQLRATKETPFTNQGGGDSAPVPVKSSGAGLAQR